MKIWPLLCLFLVYGCRQDVVVSGGTTHNGKIETVLVFKLDVSACNDLPSYAKVDCVQSLINSFNNLANIASLLNAQQGAINEAL